MDHSAKFDSLFEAWGDVVDVRDRYWDSTEWYAGFGLLPTGRIEDREHGQNRPVFETEIELDKIRANCRWLADANTFGVGIVENLSNFVIGPGFNYRAVPEKGVDDKHLVRQVQRVVDEFLDAHDWQGEGDLECFRREMRDGEIFLGLWHQDDGRTEMRFIEPERVREPLAASDTTRFGVETVDGDLSRPTGYWCYFDRMTDQPTRMPAAQVIHHKVNVDRAIKRGISDFYPLDSELPGAGKLLRAMVRGAEIQSSVPFIREHAAGTTQAQVSAIRSTNAIQTQQRTYQTGTRTEYRGNYKPGTVLDVNNGLKYKPSPLANGEAARAYVEVLGASLRTIGVRWCAPEFVISGDASNANYASTLVAGGPFVRYCERRQARLGRMFSRVLWRVISHACEAGTIDADYEQVKATLDLQVNGPSVAITDQAAETTRRAAMVAGGVMSRKTWSDKEGLDFDHEQANGAEVAQTLPVSQPTSESLRDARANKFAGIWEGYP